MSEIIKAEEGPKRADRPVTYVRAPCDNCGEDIFFFKQELYSLCVYCGNWSKKPRNGEAKTI